MKELLPLIVYPFTLIQVANHRSSTAFAGRLELKPVIYARVALAVDSVVHVGYRLFDGNPSMDQNSKHVWIKN